MFFIKRKRKEQCNGHTVLSYSLYVLGSCFVHTFPLGYSVRTLYFYTPFIPFLVSCTVSSIAIHIIRISLPSFLSNRNMYSFAAFPVSKPQFIDQHLDFHLSVVIVLILYQSHASNCSIAVQDAQTKQEPEKEQ